MCSDFLGCGRVVYQRISFDMQFSDQALVLPALSTELIGIPSFLGFPSLNAQQPPTRFHPNLESLSGSYSTTGSLWGQNRLINVGCLFYLTC